VRKNKKIAVNIPAGIDDGQTLSMRGQGNAGAGGGAPGDLYVTVSVLRHPQFERDGDAVLLSIPLSIVQAALGAEIEVPTLDGKVKYTVPEGTQTGSVFRLRGKGIPSLRGGARGDQFVTVHVETPVGLTPEQKELLRQFGQSASSGYAAPSDTSKRDGKKRKRGK
jgi:molecular chaperone DnaJ